MTDHTLYHEGMRSLQDSRETRPLADRLEQVTVHSAFTAHRPDYVPPVPAWKTFDAFRDVLPARDRDNSKKA